MASPAAALHPRHPVNHSNDPNVLHSLQELHDTLLGLVEQGMRKDQLQQARAALPLPADPPSRMHRDGPPPAQHWDARSTTVVQPSPAAAPPVPVGDDASAGDYSYYDSILDEIDTSIQEISLMDAAASPASSSHHPLAPPPRRILPPAAYTPVPISPLTPTSTMTGTSMVNHHLQQQQYLGAPPPRTALPTPPLSAGTGWTTPSGFGDVALLQQQQLEQEKMRMEQREMARVQQLQQQEQLRQQQQQQQMQPQPQQQQQQQQQHQMQHQQQQHTDAIDHITLGTLTSTEGTYFGHIDHLITSPIPPHTQHFTKRFIVVAGSTLHLFSATHTPTSTPLQTLRINPTSCNIALGGPILTLSTTNGDSMTVWTLRAQSEDEAEAWMAILNASVQLARAQEAVLRLNAPAASAPVPRLRRAVSDESMRRVGSGAGALTSAGKKPGPSNASMMVNNYFSTSAGGGGGSALSPVWSTTDVYPSTVRRNSVASGMTFDHSPPPLPPPKSPPTTSLNDAESVGSKNSSRFNIKKILNISSGGGGGGGDQSTDQHVYLVRGAGARIIKSNPALSSHDPAPRPSFETSSTQSSSSSSANVQNVAKSPSIPSSVTSGGASPARVFMVRGAPMVRQQSDASRSVKSGGGAGEVERGSFDSGGSGGGSSNGGAGIGWPGSRKAGGGKEKEKKDKVYSVRGGGRK
ncbi:hypothetical protein HDU67_000118 [Dinochytrium kinnereticum]|nr:hypothetical protein HDU67_000118 [Dinochytrium kinnereticum]